MAAEDLGQLTTEDDEVRAQICNNGAIPPLIKLLNSNVHLRTLYTNYIIRVLISR